MVSSKRVAVAAAAILSIRSATGSATPEVELAFKEFKAKYGRVYKTPEEEADRFRIFQKKLKIIQDTNAKNLSYFLGVNDFTDQETKEFESTHLGMKKPSLGAQWGGLPHLGTHKYSGAALPDSVDWVAKGAVTPVKDQAACGSCWAFSTTGSLEGAWFLKTGKLASMSEQQLVDCSTDNDGCDGGSMDSAFDFVKKQGSCSESSYPYKSGKTKTAGTCSVKNCEPVLAPGVVSGYHDVTEDDTNALMEAVAKNPVSVAIEADQDAYQQYAGGVLTKKCGNKLDHGVLAVGYGVDKGVKYWKVKNSWGASWGEEGYVRIERGVAQKDGECGIKGGATYPAVDGKPGPPAPTPAPSPPPSPTPPSPGPAPGPPGPCADARDYCSDKDIFDPSTDCALLAEDCLKTCGCCSDSPSDWCPSGPAPAPGPSPSPDANPTHYGDPKTGCQSDEMKVQVQGLSGDFCSPQCSSAGACPTDMPKGDVAKPQCALKTTTGGQYCALVCTPSALSSNGMDAECGTGTCQSIQGMGICTYAAADSLKLATQTTLELQTIVV